jgi:hypothetical protein
MATYEREGDVLKVSGAVSSEDLGAFFDRGVELVRDAGSEAVVDVTGVSLEDSSFIGTIADLGSQARLLSKTLTVRAAGRTADLLVWAGLHRLLTLRVSPGVSASVDGQ